MTTLGSKGKGVWGVLTQSGVGVQEVADDVLDMRLLSISDSV